MVQRREVREVPCFWDGNRTCFRGCRDGSAPGFLHVPIRTTSRDMFFYWPRLLPLRHPYSSSILRNRMKTFRSPPSPHHGAAPAFAVLFCTCCCCCFADCFLLPLRLRIFSSLLGLSLLFGRQHIMFLRSGHICSFPSFYLLLLLLLLLLL